MIDTTAAKKRLREYLEKRGIKIVKKTLRCPNPSHHDEQPSAHQKAEILKAELLNLTKRVAELEKRQREISR